MNPFPHYSQFDQMDCGPTCLRMIAGHYGRTYSMDSSKQRSGINREGGSLSGDQQRISGSKLSKIKP